jgi:hypothetical protein
MTEADRSQLLDDLEGLSHREAENVDQAKTFLPLPSHSLALRPEIVVIRGGRGAGKSALFKLLETLKHSSKLRDFFDDKRIPEAQWLDAFSQIGMSHPEVSTLDSLATDSTDNKLRAYWMVHLLQRLKSEIPDLPTFSRDIEKLLTAKSDQVTQWAEEGERKLTQVAASLDNIERFLQEGNQHVFASYDHLDRIGAFDPVIRRRFVATLLALWLSLSNRYKYLRAKIFLREDLFEAGEIAFPDASKLRPRSIAIEWDVESLYRVVVRHLGTSPKMRLWLSKAGLLPAARPMNPFSSLAL